MLSESGISNVNLCSKVLELIPVGRLLLGSGYVRVHTHSEQQRIDLIGRILLLKIMRPGESKFYGEGTRRGQTLNL